MTKILGNSIATAKQMSTYLLSKNPTPLLTENISILEFAQKYIDICTKENVRGDLAFVQMCEETGCLEYGGDVEYTQNNFAGIGATGSGVKGAVFESIEIGILAHAQHLKSYATKDDLNCPNVDPRRTDWFMRVKSGTSPDVETLGGTWAVPGYDIKKYSSLEEANKAKDSYGYQIINILNNILKTEKEETTMKTYVIALSAGHDLYTAGKRCDAALDPNQTREWYLNDRIMDKVEIKLKPYNCIVVRVNDTTGKTYVSNGNRAKTANNANADIYLAMHHDAAGKLGNASGTTVFYYPTGNCKATATKLYNHIIAQTGLKGNRSVPIRDGKHLVEVNSPKADAFLIENGFMDSRIDTPIILTEAHAEKTAIGVVNFLVEHFNLQKVHEEVISQETYKPSSPVETTTYTVQKTDLGLITIAKKVGVSWKSIAALNNIKAPYTIRVGQVLKIREVVVEQPQVSLYDGLDLVFEPSFYAKNHSDLMAAFGTDATALLKHYKDYGMKEGRQAIATFNPKVYKAHSEDLRNAFGDESYKPYIEHYITYGHKENRRFV